MVKGAAVCMGLQMIVLLIVSWRSIVRWHGRFSVFSAAKLGHTIVQTIRNKLTTLHVSFDLFQRAESLDECLQIQESVQTFGLEEDMLIQHLIQNEIHNGNLKEIQTFLCKTSKQKPSDLKISFNNSRTSIYRIHQKGALIIFLKTYMLSCKPIIFTQKFGKFGQTLR